MPGRGPTIGNFRHEPNPPGDAAFWVQGKDGANMNTTVDDMMGRAMAAMPQVDLDPTNGLLSDAGGNSLLALLLAAIRAGVNVYPGAQPLSVVLDQAALPVAVRLDGSPSFTLGGTPTFNLGTVAAPVPTASFGAQAAGKGQLYAAAVGPMGLLAAGAPVAMLVNPANSKRIIYLDSFHFSTGIDAYLTRGRVVAPASPGGTAVAVSANTLGAGSIPGARLHAAPTVAATSTEWGSHVKAGIPLTVQVDGRLAIPQGGAMVFSAQSLGSILGSGLLIQAALSLVWAEVPVA